jgi:hypothetical protein
MDNDDLCLLLQVIHFSLKLGVLGKDRPDNRMYSGIFNFFSME